jgi:enoyl-CoA hydratase/carnithine racemase
MDFEQILTDTSEGVLTITLNRPERLNAWTGRMGEELRAAFDLADDDDEVRAIIVTGAGRAFCAGADLRAAATPSTTASATPPAWPGATAAASSRCGSSTPRSP